MELELGLAPPNHGHPAAGSCFGKRGPAEAPRCRSSCATNSRGGPGAYDWGMSSRRKKKLVGWPPVKSAHRRGHVKVSMEGVPIGRKVDLSLHGSYQDLLHTLRLMFPSSSTQHDQDTHEELPDQDDQRRRGRGAYAVTYEDGDGDWLLIGDCAMGGLCQVGQTAQDTRVTYRLYTYLPLLAEIGRHRSARTRVDVDL